MQLIFINYLNSYKFKTALLLFNFYFYFICCGFILVSVSSFILTFKKMVSILLAASSTESCFLSLKLVKK